MSLTFNALQANIEVTAMRALIRPECEKMLAMTCARLLHDKQTYLDLQKDSTVPAAALMALAEREMTGNLHCYLGNGQPLTMRTTIVPKGRGPFGTVDRRALAADRHESAEPDEQGEPQTRSTVEMGCHCRSSLNPRDRLRSWWRTAS